MEKTSIGLEENVAGLLCYVLGWVSGLVLFLLETENKFVRFHAVQSIIVFGFLNIVGVIFGWMSWFGWIISSFVGLLAFVFWIVLMVKAYQGTMYRLPVAGDLAEKWSGKAAK
jgi:uncharacterized membrane protein